MVGTSGSVAERLSVVTPFPHPRDRRRQRVPQGAPLGLAGDGVAKRAVVFGGRIDDAIAMKIVRYFARLARDIEERFVGSCGLLTAEGRKCHLS